MTSLAFIFASLASAFASQPAAADCPSGAYQGADGDVVALTRSHPDSGPDQDRYLFEDGRHGLVSDAGAAVRCTPAGILASDPRGSWSTWRRQGLVLTATRFESDGTILQGMLIEPEERAGKPPLAVMVSGSEHYAAIGSSLPFIFAAQGITTFVYNKRGTGGSGGQYTQNFEQLGRDAAAAMNEAKRLDAGKYSRAGFIGGSQGGWVAPLAAYLSHADYDVVGFGLILTPLEEDAEQVYDELRTRGYGDDVIAKAREVTAATAAVRAAHFHGGYEQVEAVRRRYGSEPWFSQIQGEFTGDVLHTSEQELRREGAKRFPEYDINWNYDALGLMRRVNVPQLWVIAGSDREAPNRLTLQRLALLQREGKPIKVMLFPDTDHGISQFVQKPDGSRTMTKTADGFFRLEADWIKGQWQPPYGKAVEVSARN